LSIHEFSAPLEGSLLLFFDKAFVKTIFVEDSFFDLDLLIAIGHEIELLVFDESANEEGVGKNKQFNLKFD